MWLAFFANTPRYTQNFARRKCDWKSAELEKRLDEKWAWDLRNLLILTPVFQNWVQEALGSTQCDNCSLRDHKCDISRKLLLQGKIWQTHFCLTCNILGTTLVSSPHRTSGWASNIALMRVVPDLGTPPIKTMGEFRSYSYTVPSEPTLTVFLEEITLPLDWLLLTELLTVEPGLNFPECRAK